MSTAEERLRALKDDLSVTENKLLNATAELKKISADRIPEESFLDNKIQQRLTRKIQRVFQAVNAVFIFNSEIFTFETWIYRRVESV